MRRKKASLEKDLLKEVKKLLDIFKSKGVLSYRRIHVMPVMRGGKMSMNKDMAGIEDIQLYLPGGVTLMWELKKKGGKQSPAQLLRESELLKLGHRYYVIQSLSQSIEILSFYGVQL